MQWMEIVMIWFFQNRCACVRGIVIALSLLVLAPLPLLAQSQQAAPEPFELRLSEALRIAVDGNPGLAEMRERAQAAAQVPSQAGTLPDPKLNLNALNLPEIGRASCRERVCQYV